MRLIPQQTRPIAYYNKEGECCLPKEPFALYVKAFDNTRMYRRYTFHESDIRLISAVCQSSLPHALTGKECFNQLHYDITKVDIHKYSRLEICIQDDEGCKRQTFPEGFENRLLHVIQHFKEREIRSSFYLANKLALGEFSPEEPWVQEPFNEKKIQPGDVVVLMVTCEPSEHERAKARLCIKPDGRVEYENTLSPICYAVYLAEGLYLSIEDAEESLVTATMPQMRDLYKPSAVYTITPKKYSSAAHQATAVKMHHVRVEFFKGSYPEMHPKTEGFGVFSHCSDLYPSRYGAYKYPWLSPAKDPLNLKKEQIEKDDCVIT
jgi:hypothetical protein